MDRLARIAAFKLSQFGMTLEDRADSLVRIGRARRLACSPNGPVCVAGGENAGVDVHSAAPWW